METTKMTYPKIQSSEERIEPITASAETLSEFENGLSDTCEIGS